METSVNPARQRRSSTMDGAARAFAVPNVFTAAGEAREVILSIHVPKTAGMSFGGILKSEYGDRLLLDYGDYQNWVGADSRPAILRRVQEEARLRRDELSQKYQVIHGHFFPEKYIGLFPKADFVAFFRDPFEQTISNYEFLRRHPEAAAEYPAVRIFHECRMSVEEYIAWPQAPQCDAISGLSIDDLALAGLTEKFSEGIALFNVLFQTNLTSDVRLNPNPFREEQRYSISDDLRRFIEKHRQPDIELYQRAVERFKQLAARHLRP